MLFRSRPSPVPFAPGSFPFVCPYPVTPLGNTFPPRSRSSLRSLRRGGGGGWDKDGERYETWVRVDIAELLEGQRSWGRPRRDRAWSCEKEEQDASQQLKPRGRVRVRDGVSSVATPVARRRCTVQSFSGAARRPPNPRRRSRRPRLSTRCPALSDAHLFAAFNRTYLEELGAVGGDENEGGEEGR